MTMSAEDCTKLKARIDALDTAIDDQLTGKRAKRVGYGGRMVETSETTIAELRQRKAELERRYKACGCSPALETASVEKGRHAIRPVQR
ncbi:MAG: hypothetical protein AAFY22_05925 [Pseudomonadota bacterium]